MDISMQTASAGVFIRVLRNLSNILDKAEQWVTARGIDPNAILQARLAPDMFTFTRQVQIATDMAKGTVGRLTGQPPPSFPDNEASFAELKQRLAKTIAYLEGVPAAAFEGSATRPVSLKVGPPGKQNELNFASGVEYLQGFGTPNVYFHYSMAYALLRHNGMEIGKRDFVA